MARMAHKEKRFGAQKTSGAQCNGNEHTKCHETSPCSPCVPPHACPHSCMRACPPMHVPTPACVPPHACPHTCVRAPLCMRATSCMPAPPCRHAPSVAVSPWPYLQCPPGLTCRVVMSGDTEVAPLARRSAAVACAEAPESVLESVASAAAARLPMAALTVMVAPAQGAGLQGSRVLGLRSDRDGGTGCRASEL